MAVGKLTVVPASLRGLPPNIQGARFFVGCFVQTNEKHRTHSQDGPDPRWQDELTCTISEKDRYLNLELVDENSSVGLVAHSEVALDRVFNQGTDSTYIQFKNSLNQPFCEALVHLSFSGSNTMSSFDEMNIRGENASYQASSSYSQTTSFSQSSHQGSFSSLGPVNPVPANYGAGAPPPFTPPISSYGQGYVSGPSGTELPDMNRGQDVDYSMVMTREQFEEGKTRGTIPTWAKYAGAAIAIGATIYAAHELKEHHDKKKKEEEKHKYKPAYGAPHGYSGMQGGYVQGNMLGYDKKTAKKQEKMARKAEKQARRQHKRETRHGRGGSSSSSSSSSSDSD